MNFATAMNFESAKTTTENGCDALRTSFNPIVDLFGCIGGLRDADEQRIYRLFEEAVQADKLLATKILFYARDVRGGLGERQTFRTLLRYAADHYPEIVLSNIDLIGVYGRYDDLYSLVGTKCEENMWHYVLVRLKTDEKLMREGHACSLLAKWLKTADASSKNTRKLGIYTAKALNMSVYEYKRRIRSLRKYIDVVESKMSTNRWAEIDYETVPSRAAMLYRSAFVRHDEQRYSSYVTAVSRGEAKINAGTLFPYDLVRAYCRNSNTNIGYDGFVYDPVIEAQWEALPDYVGEDASAIVIADTSGSMTCCNGLPMYSAVSLAIYFAQRNRGPFHNLWMSFSGDSQVNKLQGATLAQNLEAIDTRHWGWNTNLEEAFHKILTLAIMGNVKPEDMPKSLIVISDMEIDRCECSGWTFYDEMAERFEEFGYTIPNVVFWNVNSRHDVFHADATRRGVQLVSGQSAATFQHLMKSIGMSPLEMMLDVLNGERYDLIKVIG